jgi:hypothetical protein
VFAGIIPNTLLTVEGSARTLTWVDVIPSTGDMVGRDRGESEVSDGRGVKVVGNVAVMMNGACVGLAVSRIPKLQLVLKKMSRVNAAIDILMDTAGFYRLSY